MDTLSDTPSDQPSPAAVIGGAAPRPGFLLLLQGLLKRRSVWIVAGLIVLGAGFAGYHWAFGKAKVVYATVGVERGDIESTVVAAGLVQPFKYVDVGAQTSGMLKT